MSAWPRVAVAFVVLGPLTSACDADNELVPIEVPFSSPEKDESASCYGGEVLQGGEDVFRVGDERSFALVGVEEDVHVVATGGVGCVSRGRVARVCEWSDGEMVTLRGVAAGPAIVSAVRADGRTVASSEVLWVNPFHVAWRRSDAGSSQGLSTLEFATTLASEDDVFIGGDGFEARATVSSDRSVTTVMPSQLRKFVVRVGTTEVRCELTPLERGNVVATVLSVSRRSDTDDEIEGVAFLRLEGASSPDVRVRGLPPSTEVEVLGPLDDNDETAVRFVARGPFWMTVEAGDQYDSVLVPF